MSRAKWKGPFLNTTLAKMKNLTGTSLKGFSRSSSILPVFVGKNFEIHNGKKFLTLRVTISMIGHKFGEFVPTKKSHKYKKHN